MEEFARGRGISTTEARTAFDESAAILDFKSRSTAHAGFGAVWVEYAPSYQVHVRTVESSFDEQVVAFERGLGHAVVRHTGGASAAALDSIASQLAAVRPPIGHQADEKRGVVEVWETHRDRVPPDLKDSPFVVFGAEPEQIQPM